ncbi:BPI fold-containing family B member 2 [Passer domesticus]|uniref:BPI fold-containing family B member 2 n=1 Tax=Passer domesticus TaxID=48849 RepID=UPI0030FE0730
MLRTLSLLLSLLVPAHTTRSPDCGGILSPSGLRYRKCRATPPLPAAGSDTFLSAGGTPNTGTTISCHCSAYPPHPLPIAGGQQGMEMGFSLSIRTQAPEALIKHLLCFTVAEVSKPHAESVLRRDLMAPPAPAPSPTSPSRNQIISVKVDKFSLTIIPDTGMRLSIEVDLGTSSAPSATKEMKLSIRADLHVDMNPEGNLELVTSDCKPTLEEVQSTEETGSKSSGSDVDKQIDIEKICLEVSRLLLLPNERLMSLAAPFPITPNCQVQYLPLAAPMYSEQGIIISLQTTFQVAGTVVPLPVSPVPFSMPEPASSSPSHLILAFSEHFYTSLFSALEESGALNVSLLSSLTTATLAERITQMGSLFQEDLPVVLQAVTRSSPHVVLEEDKAIVQLFLTAHIGAGSSPFQSFLSVNVDVTARLHLSVADTRMIISVAAVEDIELSLATSDVGPILAALLEELFLPTIREEVPAQINKVLRQGVFLPHIASFTYTDVNITIHKDYVLIPCNLQLEARAAEARTWE